MSAPFSDPGSFRSVADITDTDTLDKVRAVQTGPESGEQGQEPAEKAATPTKKARRPGKATAPAASGPNKKAAASKATATTHAKTATRTPNPCVSLRREALSAHDTGRLAERHLYLCTADRPDLAQFLDSCMAGGVDIVQLRDKHLEARHIVERGRLAARVCADHGVPFVLNDRPDLALEIGADGVHVGQDDASPALARRILGARRLVGLSTHAPEELESSRDEPVDYVSAGPVHPTPTKPGRPGTGPHYVTFAWPTRPARSSSPAGSPPRRCRHWRLPEHAISSSSAT